MNRELVQGSREILREALAEILIVEDDTVFLEALAYNLTWQGFRVHKATDGTQALQMARRIGPDLILLDSMLPVESSIKVCERIRKEDKTVVIIIIAEDAGEEDKVQGFEAGADDFVTKPFGMKELVARINAILKRSAASVGTRRRILEAGDLLLDTKNFTAWVKDEPLNLKPMAFKLLVALADQPGELKSRKELAKEVWGHAGVESSRTIDNHICQIRAALEKNGNYEYIHTARSLGYRFEARLKNNV